MLLRLGFVARLPDNSDQVLDVGLIQDLEVHGANELHVVVNFLDLVGHVREGKVVDRREQLFREM